MEPKELYRTLVDLAGRVGYVPDAHDLDDGLDLFRRERMVAGLLKPRSLSVYEQRCRFLSDWRGDADLVSTNWRTEAAGLYKERGSRAWGPLQVLRSVLILAQREGWRNAQHGLDAVLKKAEYQPREAVWDERQAAAFLAACERLDRAEVSERATFAGGSVRQRAREVLRVLALTGCRLREICYLRFDEVGPRYLRLKDSKTGPRTVPICEQAQLVIGRQSIASGYVFPGRDPAKPIGARTVQSMFDVVKREAGLIDGCVHSLRHSYCSIATRNGVPIPVLQMITGHRAAYLTLRYVHMAKRDAEIAVAVVSNAIANGGGHV